MKHNAKTREKANKLRETTNDPVYDVFWTVVRSRRLGVSFTRFKPRYGAIVDFYCDALKLVFGRNMSTELVSMLESKGLHVLNWTATGYGERDIEAAIKAKILSIKPDHEFPAVEVDAGAEA